MSCGLTMTAAGEILLANPAATGLLDVANGLFTGTANYIVTPGAGLDSFD